VKKGEEGKGGVKQKEREGEETPIGKGFEKITGGGTYQRRVARGESVNNTTVHCGKKKKIPGEAQRNTHDGG